MRVCKRLLFAPRLEMVLKPPSRALNGHWQIKVWEHFTTILADLQAETGFC
jgi:hypothetical protein